jgi:uncharacterized protein YlzI (FlbEa/FlbD family)
MIKLTKQNASTPIYINHNFIVSMEDIQNGSKLCLQTGSNHVLVKENALEILELIKKL